MTEGMKLFAALLMAVSLGARAQGAVETAGEDAQGVEWTSVPVRGPVSLEDVSGLPPYVGESVPEVRGELEVGPKKGAALWLSGLEVIQLRADPGVLRFHRLTGGDAPGDSWLRVEEPGLPVRAGVWYLSEPIGEGSVWVVTATRPTRLQVERPELPKTEGTDEVLRAELLHWVDGRGPMPGLPFHAELRHRMAVDAELGAALLRGVPANDVLHDAVRAWRKAAAIKALWALQPLDGPSLRTAWESPPGEQVQFDGFLRAFSRVGAEGAYETKVEGPGVLVVDARAVVGEGAAPEPVVGVEDEAGRLLAELPLPVSGARMGEATALPGSRPTRTLGEGERVGRGEELRIPLGEGAQVVRLKWRGGQVLLRARVVSRRPMLIEKWRGLTDWPSFADEARNAAARSEAPSARLLERLVAQLQGGAAAAKAPPNAASVPDEALSAELRLFGLLQVASATADAGKRRALANQVRALFDDPWLASGSELAWSLRVKAARLLVETGETDKARELLRGASALPRSGHVTAELAEVLLQIPGGISWRSRALGAMELAWRQEPLALDVRSRYRAAFYRHGRWATLSPLTDDDRPKPLPARWLDVETVEDESAPGAGAHFALEPGQSVRIGGATGAGNARLLRAYVLTPEGAPQVPVVHVDRLRVPLMPLGAVEPVEVALPQGEHVVRLEAPTGTRAWISIPPAQGHAHASGEGEVAYLRTHYPARARGRAVHFPIPDSQVPGPVRLQLRAASDKGAPIPLWIHTDVGQPRRAVLFPGSPSPRHLSVDERAGAGSSASALVLHLPAHTREVWLAPDDAEARLFVSVAVRRPPRTPEELLAAKKPSPRDVSQAEVERLLELSRALDADVDPRVLLDRAELLLDVGEEGYARDDLVRALGRQRALTQEDGERLATLLEKMEGDPQDTGRFVDTATEMNGPLLLAPGSARLGGDDVERAALSLKVRGLAPGDALRALGDGNSQLERYLRARLHAAHRAPERAALELLRLYRETDRLELGMDALGAIERVQTLPSAWTEWGAPMGVALTSQLERVVDLPSVRRVRHNARRFARWHRLRDADTQVGTLDLLRSGGDEPQEQIFLALHAPPWALAGTRVLPLGHAAVLQMGVQKTERVGVEVMCQAVRADVRPPGEPCQFALRLDGREVDSARARVGEVVSLSVELQPGGRHQVEVVFNAKVTSTAAARFVSFDAQGQVARALEAEAPMPVLRARPGVPVELTALGPTAVRLEARAFGDDTQLTVLDGEGRTPRILQLSSEKDAEIHNAPFVVGRPSELLLLLPDEGPHRLRFEANGGEALVRVGLGGTRKPSERRAEWWTRSPTALEPLPWPAQPEALTHLPEGGVVPGDTRVGTLSLDVGLLGEALDEGELDRPLEGRVRGSVAYRQELSPRRAWVLISPEVRHPLDRSAAFGGTAGVHLRQLPLQLRTTLMGRVFAQNPGPGLRYGARFRGSVDRWIGLTPDLGLIPGFGLTLEHFGGAPAEGTDLYDRSVYWRYGEQHPIRPSPRLSLRWQPLQDQIGSVSAWVVQNPELVTLDHAAARVNWQGLLPFYPNARGSLGYEASWRMADLHRQEPYLRHGLRARADVGIWSGTEGRLLFYAENATWLGTPFGLQNTVTAGVRWDWTRGRGLQDFMPFEEEFDEQVTGPQ